MASSVYNNAKKLIGDGTIDWDASDIRVLLVQPAYSPNIDTHVFVADVASELSGGTYARKSIANRAESVDNVNDRADYTADNVTWAALAAGGQTAAAAVVYKFVTNDADSLLIAYIDFTDTVTNGGDFTVKWAGGATNGRVFSVS